MVATPLRSVLDFVSSVPASVHTKLFVGFFVGSLLLMGMAVLSVVVIDRMSQRVEELSVQQQNMNRARRMEYLITAQSHFRAMSLLTQQSFWNDDIGLAKKEFSEHLDTLESESLPEKQELFSQLEESNQRFAVSSSKVLDLYEQGEIDEALALHIAEEHEISHEIEDAMRELIVSSSSETADAVAGFQNDKALLKNVVLAFSIASMLIATLLGFIISWAIIRPVRKIDHVVAAVASGDFTQRVTVPNRDELGKLGQNFNKMSEQLASLYERLNLELLERKQAEEALQDARANLEKRVEERTRQLRSANDRMIKEMSERKQIEEQLFRAQKMEAMGRMAGGIAHDFKNLLIPIIGYSEMGMKTLPPDHCTTVYLQTIRSAAERGSRLINQLMVFARGQAIEPKIVNLNHLLVDIHEILRRLVSRNVELVLALAPDLALVKVDPGKIEQILLNLVVNASDAMPDGGQLTIETANTSLSSNLSTEQCESSPSTHVVLSVCDTGVGMTEEVKSRIFEPFFTTKGKDSGTGLGLATCYALVEQSGGRIDVESQLGQGTVFKVYFPQTEANIQPAVC